MGVLQKPSSSTLVLLVPFVLFVLNAEKIRYIEATPDTVVCCDSGEKMMVKESLAEVMRKAIEYSRIVRRAITRVIPE